ncbi:MAG TPA: hypothetical protein VF618_24990 [Thermoanaerobaculia bacterium]
MPAIDVSVRNLQTYTLISGIANSLAVAIGLVSVTIAGLGTCGVGCLLVVLPMIHLAGAIIDFMAYSRLDQPPSIAVYSATKISAIADLTAGLAIVPLIMGIMKLSILGDEEVQRHFGLTGQATTDAAV